MVILGGWVFLMSKVPLYSRTSATDAKVIYLIIVTGTPHDRNAGVFRSFMFWVERGS